jgi:hypothetical protein
VEDNPVPEQPLSQVVFIHDYVQLIFQNEGFSIFNRSKLTPTSGVLHYGEREFADALVRLIGHRVVACSMGEGLTLTFEGGEVFSVLADEEDVRGPEAFSYARDGVTLVVEQNA